MLTLKGRLIRKPRAQIVAPLDGVHRNGSDGFLKGAHAMYLAKPLNPKKCFEKGNFDMYPEFYFLPHGQVSLYYYTTGGKGLKIFVSAKHGWHRTKKYVKAVRRRMRRYHKLGIAPNAYGIQQVEVDFNYKDKVKYHKKVWALEVDHCYYTPDFENYCNGVPLEFDKYDYQDYNPKGFLKFKKKVDKILSSEDKKILRKVGDSYKIGDLVYCVKSKRWQMVDWG